MTIVSKTRVKLQSKYQIFEEELDKVLSFITPETRQILLKEWRQNPNIPRPTRKEASDAEKEFKDALGILYLRNYENFDPQYTKAIGIMIMHCFYMNSAWVERRLIQHYDAEYIVLCIKTYLTDKERRVIEARYGLDDGRKKTIEQVRKVTNMHYTRQWIHSLLYQAERKICCRIYAKQKKEIES